jgi:hypothetical protein
VIKNFPGFRRDFRAKMWGTSSPDDKLADDLGNAIEGTRISGRRSDFLTAGKLAPGYFGLLQQNRHTAAKVSAAVCPQLVNADSRIMPHLLVNRSNSA